MLFHEPFDASVDVTEARKVVMPSADQFV